MKVRTRMETKLKIKEEDPLLEDVTSQNDREFFTECVTMKTHSDAVLLGNDCEVVIKPEINSEAPSPDFCSQEEQNCFAKCFINQMKSETDTGSNNCETETKTEVEEQTLLSDFGLQNEREFLPENSVMKVIKCNSDHEIDKIEIKIEPWWLETETSSVCDDIKDEDFSPAKSSRLCLEAVSGDRNGKASLPSDEVSGKEIGFYDVKDHPECENQGSYVTKIPIVEEHIYSDQSDKCSDGGEIYSNILCSKQKHEGERAYKINTCEKNFTHVSHLKSNTFIQGSERPFRCNICDKRFTKLFNLERHSLIHEKPHQCKTCYKTFTELLNLKKHSFVHQGKKPYQCKTCDKNFTRLANLKRHNLIHEGKKLYQCRTCDKNFTSLSYLKLHSLIHEGKRPYQCKICGKSFTLSTYLKVHSVVHEGKKPHQCRTCGKNFTRLSDLKRHTLTHEGKKPHQC